MNTIEQQGDEMVERYLRLHWRMTNEAATRCAIAHCKRVIEVLEKSKPLSVYELNNHRLILSELEGRVK